MVLGVRVNVEIHHGVEEGGQRTGSCLPAAEEHDQHPTVCCSFGLSL